ncbi:MAG: acyl--CoA ligase, partial [Alphaproteobacteria bacterium]|nr:acyl--CoA ligase [Alphaproteobacteria bacterium]
GQFELVEDRSLGYPIRVYKNAPPSMRAVLESTRAFDDRTFMIYGDEVITYRQHFERVAALAHFLRDKGVAKGDRVAIGMRNYPEWMISFWACQAIGAIAVALNAWWTGPELSYALEDSTPGALLIDGERLERIAPLLPLSFVKTIVVARREGRGTQGEEFSTVTSRKVDGLPPADIGPNDYCTILYTSGTTGKPKGAVATHRNHVTNVMNSLLGGAVVRTMLGDAAPDPALAPQPAALQTFPFFHIGGLTGLYVTTAIGGKLALMYKWDPAEGVRLVEKHRLSSVAGVPIVVRQLLESARHSGADVSSLLAVASGGAAVPPDLIRQIGKQFEMKTSPGNGYGLTETTSAVISNSGVEYHAHPDSIGRPVPGTDVRVVDDNGNDVHSAEIGEIWIRGPNVIPGYWKNPEATEAAFGGGWFRTGDLGYRDSEGLYYVVDRKKDVIIRGGENVYCAEVEAAILEHPMVKDVAVVGLPDPEYGEQVAAVIQVRDPARAQSLPEELRTSLATTLAKFKIPSSYKLTEHDLPRTATGKVLKRELRELFKGT